MYSRKGKIKRKINKNTSTYVKRILLCALLLWGAASCRSSKSATTTGATQTNQNTATDLSTTPAKSSTTVPQANQSSGGLQKAQERLEVK